MRSVAMTTGASRPAGWSNCPANASPSRCRRSRTSSADEPFVLHLADSFSKHDLGSLLGGDDPADDEALLVVQETADMPAEVSTSAHVAACWARAR